MMTNTKSIAIETSGRRGSVAIGIDGTTIEECLFSKDMAHARELVPSLQNLCEKHQWHVQDIQQLSLTIGPGSFTGLRIAVSFAKTISFAQNLALIPVPTTEPLVLNASQIVTNGDKVAVLLDAKRKQIYAAVYECDSDYPGDTEKFGFAPGFRCLQPASLTKVADLAERFGTGLHVLGEGIPQHRAALEQAQAQLLPEPLWSCRAAKTLEVGYRRAQLLDPADPALLQPLYLRRPEAVERWEKLHNTVDPNF